MSLVHVHVAECGETYSGMSGEITSWNYPNNYINNLRCVYNIQVPSGYQVCVTIEDFEMGDSNDRLTIDDEFYRMITIVDENR